MSLLALLDTLTKVLMTETPSGVIPDIQQDDQQKDTQQSAQQQEADQQNTQEAGQKESEDDWTIPERFKPYVKELREEAKKYRLELAQLRDEQKKQKTEAERAKMDAVDKLKAEKADMEKELNEYKSRYELLGKRSGVIAIASKLNFIDPSDAVAFVDIASVEIDENGSIRTDEIEEALKEVLSKKPYLAKSTQQANQQEDSQQNNIVPAVEVGATNPGNPNQPTPQQQVNQRQQRFKTANENMAKGYKDAALNSAILAHLGK